MKTRTIGILMLLVVVGIISVIWAQGQTTPMSKMEEGKKMMRPDGMPKGCPACGAMMHIQMLPTEDGHIIVLVGNTLQKYDADLQLVKEAELKIDMQKMHQHMQDMMKSCPMQNCPMMQK